MDEIAEWGRKRSIKIPIDEQLYREVEQMHRDEGRPLEAIIEEALMEYSARKKRSPDKWQSRL